MSIKANSVINLPVITINTGNPIFTVKDVIYDGFSNKVTALVVDEGGWFKGAKVILTHNIHSIGKDAVLIEDDTKVSNVDDVDNSISATANEENYLTKNEVMTEGGAKLGRVTDIYFEFPGGAVTALEVSEGFMQNIASGNKKIFVENIITIGEKYLIVHEDTEAQLKEQAEVQGLQGAFNSTKENAGNLMETAKEKGGELVENTKIAAVDLADKSKVVAADLAEKTRQAAETAQVRANLLAKEAQNRGQEFVDSGKPQEIFDNTKSAFSSATATVAQTTMDVKDKVTSAATSTSQQAQAQVLQSRIQGALGKRLGNVTILSLNDEIIAQPGSLITHELVELASQHGMIDKVLNNVV